MSVLRRVTRGIRDAWLIFGISLLLLTGLELGYRGYRKARSYQPGDSTENQSRHPYAGQEWWAAFRPYVEDVPRPNRFDAYRGYWPLAAKLPFLTVDSAGRRVTVQPPGSRLRAVYMLGGSAMWGYNARDSFTIPSLTAAALARRGLHDIDIVNLAQAGYNSTQELNTLILEVLRGRPPVLAVFLGGFNDLVLARNGVPGSTYLDERIQRQVALGGRNFWQEVIGLGRHSAVVRRLRRGVTSKATLDPPVLLEQHCGRLASYYREVTRVADVVARTYGFRVIYFLQPLLVTSRKPRSPWEKQIVTRRTMATCMASLDSAMSDGSGPNFYSLAGVFDADSTTMFIDDWGHITESANRKVAERIADVIAPLLQANAEGVTRSGPKERRVDAPGGLPLP